MPKPTKKPKPDDHKQYKRFLETAEEVEAEEDTAAFERAFVRVATRTGHPAWRRITRNSS